MLTGKYLDVPAATDDTNRVRSMASSLKPRGRMDEKGWGRTLYRYRSGPADDATRRYAKLAAAYGMSLTELSLRWCAARGRGPSHPHPGHHPRPGPDPDSNPDPDPDPDP